MLRKCIRRSMSLINSPSMSRPVQERVMSTASWPVPYYKRFMRAHPSPNSRKIVIEVRSEKMTDDDVVDLKFKMELNPEKREIMTAYENNIKTDSNPVFLFIYIKTLMNLTII